MKISLEYDSKKNISYDLLILGTFAKDKSLNLSKWPKKIKEIFMATPGAKKFDGKGGDFLFYDQSQAYLALGLGEQRDFDEEKLRKSTAKTYLNIKKKYHSLAIQTDTFGNLELSCTIQIMAEALFMASYQFDKYLTSKHEKKREDTTLVFQAPNSAKIKNALKRAKIIADSINVARDFINEPPNVLRSPTYAEGIKKDIQTNLKGHEVKIKVLEEKALRREKMNLFLCVNAGSGFEPQLVHLTYTPKKVTKNTKHIALVGKGLVFDTGGYSLKPATSIINMKYDMAGSATMYGAFRACVALGLNVKLTCILGITDNAISSLATMPDSIIKGRNGKTVEILNTDAEGRLVLADCLDYACDQKPDVIIDAATLTGACLVALGSEVCGLMTNDRLLGDKLLQSAKRQREYMWELPIIEEFRDDMKSKIADLRNIGNKHFAGTAKAAAFLEEFIKDDISWAHLDIAGVANSQQHLPYCPANGASGLIVRTLIDFIDHA